MTVNPPTAAPANSASAILGRKLDSIPFSAFHVAVILVLGLVGFVDGYDLALTGSLLVLAKGPLHITPDQIRWLTIAATMFVVVGGFIASAISDHVSRKLIIQIGVVGMTFFTLMIPLVQNAEQLIIVRLLTGIGLGFAITAPFPVAAELMPAQHRRTYGAIYEICLASAFALLPFVGAMLADDPNGFRLIALPGGLALFVVPVIVHFVIPQSPRWQLRRGQTAGGDRHRKPVHPALRQPRAADDGRRSRPEPAPGARATAAVQRPVCQRPVPLDRGRDPDQHLRRHRLLPERDPAAESPDRPGRRGDDELRHHHDRVHGDDPRQGVHRLPDGNHRPALDHRLRAFGCVPRAYPDGDGTSGRGGTPAS